MTAESAPIGQSSVMSMDICITQDLTVKQSIDQSIDQSIKQPVDQSINSSMDQSTTPDQCPLSQSSLTDEDNSTINQTVEQDDEATDSDTDLEDFEARSARQPISPQPDAEPTNFSIPAFTASGRPMRASRAMNEQQRKPAVKQPAKQPRRRSTAKTNDQSNDQSAQPSSQWNDQSHCSACEGFGELVECEGVCGRWFHRQCNQSSDESIDQSDSDEFLCSDCSIDSLDCLICRQAGQPDFDLHRCMKPHCRSFMHRDCADNHKHALVKTLKIPVIKPSNEQSNSDSNDPSTDQSIKQPAKKQVTEGFRLQCPYHTCSACKTSRQSKLIRCVRCPVAYHEACLPDDSLLRFGESNFMICNTELHQLWDTTNLEQPSDDSAESPIEPLSDQSIDQPIDQSVDQSIDQSNHQTTDQPTAQPIDQTSVSLDQDKPIVSVVSVQPSNSSINQSNTQSNTHSEAVYSINDPLTSLINQFINQTINQSINPISVYESSLFNPSFKQFTVKLKHLEYADKKPREQSANQSNKPTGYKHISRNFWNDVFVARPPASSNQYDSCQCDISEGCGRSCVNRAMLVECSRRCELGDACGNQRLSRRQYAKTKVVNTESRGFGLIADREINAGDLIIEYCGEVVSEEECLSRLDSYTATGQSDFYMFKIRTGLVLDAHHMGNNARFINHSCDPNAQTELWTVGAQERVAIVAKRTIEAGEEITYDYNCTTFHLPGCEQPCRCGAENCRKFLGRKATKVIKKVTKKSSRAAAKAPRKRKVVVDDEETESEDLDDDMLSQSIDQSINQSVKQSHDQSDGQSDHDSVAQSMEQ